MRLTSSHSTQQGVHVIDIVKCDLKLMIASIMLLTLDSRARLNNGVEIPYLGLGVSLPITTWQDNPTYCEICAKDWIPAHRYRHGIW
jgi:hypothetical protein